MTAIRWLVDKLDIVGNALVDVELKYWIWVNRHTMVKVEVKNSLEVESALTAEIHDPSKCVRDGVGKCGYKKMELGEAVERYNVRFCINCFYEQHHMQYRSNTWSKGT